MLSPEFLAQLERLSLAARRLRRGTAGGAQQTRRRGRSAEFTGHRPYAPGDEPRFIDWNVCARLGQLCTKLFLAEEALEARVVIDASASMAPKFAFACELAAAVGYLALAAGNRVRLAASRAAPGTDALPNAAPAVTPPLKGKASFPRLQSFLEALSPTGAPALAAVGAAAAAAPWRGDGLCLIVSDFLDPAGPEAALAAAARPGGELYAVQVLDAAEIAPPAGAAALAVTGLEEGEVLRLEGGPELAAAYQAALDEHAAAMSRACRRHGAEWWRLDAGGDLREAVLESLRRAGLTR